MAVPFEGSISLRGISNEKDQNDYYADSKEVGTVFFSDIINGGNEAGSLISYERTNENSPEYPGHGPKPDRFSQWRNYDHDADGKGDPPKEDPKEPGGKI